MTPLRQTGHRDMWTHPPADACHRTASQPAQSTAGCAHALDRQAQVLDGQLTPSTSLKVTPVDCILLLAFKPTDTIFGGPGHQTTSCMIQVTQRQPKCNSCTEAPWPPDDKDPRFLIQQALPWLLSASAATHISLQRSSHFLWAHFTTSHISTASQQLSTKQC